MVLAHCVCFWEVGIKGKNTIAGTFELEWQHYKHHNTSAKLPNNDIIKFFQKIIFSNICSFLKYLGPHYQSKNIFFYSLFCA